MGVQKREHFGSRWAVISTMAGSAIGLGNIWRFPYMVGEHGGAAFVLIYILATILISMPVFIAEVTVGRRSRASAFSAMSKLDPDHSIWKAAGVMAVAIPIIIASYYSVIGGWSLDFLIKSCEAEFVRNDPSSVSALFPEFLGSGWIPVIVHLVFMGACAFIVAHGIKSGIEKFSKITIPALFVLIVLMVVYSVSLPGAGAGVSYLLHPDFGKITPRSCAYAMGQSFYSLSLGMGTIITYGSYVSRKEDIIASSAGTALSDLLFAILAGFAIMPAVFAAGIEPGAGPGLVFQSIPYIFSSLGASYPVISTIVSVFFFLAVVVAAMTSLISLLEVGVSFLVENKGFSRRKASLLLFILCGSVGSFCSLSLGPLSYITVGGMTIFDIFDWFSSNILLPILAFTVVIFVGRVMPRKDVRNEINSKFFEPVYFLIRWIAPVFLAILFISNFIL